MREPVSTEEAITKGRQMVLQPARYIFIIPTFFWFGIAIVGRFPFWVFPTELVLALVLSWLYRSIMVSRWRLWAFENVRDVHKLKKRAIEEKLIWKDGSLFEKTEICNAAQKEKWILLRDRFEQNELFMDDPGIPDETVIHYEKGKNSWLVFIYIWCIVFGLYQIIANKSYIYGPVLLLLGSYWLYRWNKIRTDFRPQIVINSNGIMTRRKGFHQWSEISNDRVISKAVAKNTVHHYLVYDYPGGAERLYINDLNTDEKTLNNLLEVYRGRNHEKEPS